MPNSAARAFVKVPGPGPRQKFIIQPRIDAAAFFNETGASAGDDAWGRSARPRTFVKHWGIDYLGAPLDARHVLWHGGGS